MRVLYIDIFFLVNLAIDYLLLLASASFSGLPYKRLRLAAGAAAGAVYAVVSCLDALSFLRRPIPILLCGLIVALLSFGFGNPSFFLKRWGIFLAISMLFGGAMTAVTPMFTADGVIFAGAPIWGKAPLIVLFAALTYGAISTFFSDSGTHGIKREITKIEIELNGKKTSFLALLDTGNTLRDPITQSKVIIAEFEAVRGLLSYQCRSLIDADDLSDPTEIIERLSLAGAPDRLRIIPYRAVGKAGMLLAFAADAIRIGGRSSPDKIVAISPGVISEGAGYCALI